MLSSTSIKLGGKAPASIRAYQNTGVASSILRKLLTQYFEFPPLFRDLLSSYFCLYWNPEYFRKVSVGGVIHRDDREYVVIFHAGCTPNSLLRHSQVKLSFRAALPIYNLPAYVLVMPASSK